jgi:ABC-type branched-subunit amino acid transport system substrate-binding protein
MMSSLCKLCILCVSVVVGASLSLTTEAQSAQSLHRELLTASERRGKEIFLRGTSPSGNTITGWMGELSVPASNLNCSGCHGMRGEGKTESGITAGNLTWPNLTKPYGHTHPTGRKHGPFNESSFIRAVVNGVDSNGNELLAAMPRYKISAADMADLIAYLKRIDSDLDPGLTDSSVRIGLVLPTEGALADTGAAMKDVLSAYFDDLNNRGGTYNRKIHLRIGNVAQTLARDEQVFAFVGGLSAGADSQLATLARNEEIPFIGPSTLLPHVESPVNRYLFYLLPGIEEQAISLVNFAATQPELQNASIAIVHNGNPLGIAAASAAQRQAKKIGLKQIDTTGINNLKNSGAKAVFFFGNGKEQSDLLREAEADNWRPYFFFLGVLTGKELPISALNDKLFVAFPTLPADITSEGMSEFRALHEKYKFAPRHTVSQLAAFAAAKVFVAALTRAGKDLSREALITALESLYDYDTGITPRITFGPNKRVGAAGAHVIRIDLAEKQFPTASGWIKAY